MDKNREVELVSKCQTGDRQALNALVRHFERPVFNAAYRMLGNVDEAADVTQTAFLKFFENMHQFKPEFRLFSWIYRIAVNEAIDQYNRRKRFEPLTEMPRSSGDVSQENVAECQRATEIQSVLQALNADHRAVIVLHYFVGCSYRQIGEILDLPEKTVKSRLFSARQHMKNLLEQHGILSS